jgi:peroxiredoxin
MSASCASASAAALVGGGASATLSYNRNNNIDSRRASTGSSASFTGRRSEGATARRRRGIVNVVRGEKRLPTAKLFFSSSRASANNNNNNNNNDRRGDFACDVKAVVHPNNEREREEQSTNKYNSTTKYYPLIKKGDAIPNSSLQYFDHEGNLQSIETATQLCAKGKTIVIFAVPGAFLPTCTNKHLPGFIDLAAEMKSAGCDLIACVSVNDAFVMDAWGKAVGAAPVLMCGDGSGDFTRKLGCELDLMDKGLGIRSRRYAMIIKDGIVEYIEMERGGAFTRSRAEDVLQVLEKINKFESG